MKNTVRNWRVFLGFTQEDLAQRVGVSRQAIYSIESGKYNPSVELALKISKELGKPIEELFHLED
ncbi:MAG: helix-turn-helix transcriptional regulator [Spirosomataceae bacterium]